MQMIYNWIDIEKTFKMSDHTIPFEQGISYQSKKNVDGHLHFWPLMPNSFLKMGHVSTYFKCLFDIYSMVYHLY